MSHSRRMSKGTIAFRAFLTLAVLGTLLLAALANLRVSNNDDKASSTETSVSDDADEPPADITTGDAAAKQATLVAQEDTRVAQIAGATSAARYQFSDQKSAYRLDTFDDTTTLVLTPDKPRYSWNDVKSLLGDSVTSQGNGAYLVRESIAVSPGATLTLNSDDVDEIRLASGPTGMTSIISVGGTLNLIGTAARPLKITSWNAIADGPDINMSDGRSYLRALGGTFNLNYVQTANLGFWSGRTGGVAFTGTDNTDGSTTALVTGSVLDSTLRSSAYGLFVNSAKDVQIARSTASDNMLDGFLLHRSVTGVTVANCIASNNGANGFVVDRGVNGVAFTSVTSENNGQDGINLDGQPLASGPSASGAPIIATGDHSVTDSTVRGNGGDGIEILGGSSVSVLRNTIEGNDMGIKLRGGAAGTTIVDNRLRGQDRFGIFARDGVTNTTITGNDIAGGTISVYLRDTTGNTVRNNSISRAGGHAVSMVDYVGTTIVSDNNLGGKGTSAVDSRRATGDITVEDNDTSNWQPPSVTYAVIHWLLHPLRATWAIIILVLVLSALFARRKRYRRNNPYSKQWRTTPYRPSDGPSGAASARPAPEAAIPAARERDRELVGAGVGAGVGAASLVAAAIPSSNGSHPSTASIGSSANSPGGSPGAAAAEPAIDVAPDAAPPAEPNPPSAAPEQRRPPMGEWT